MNYSINILVEWASGSDNWRGAAGTYKDKFDISTAFMSQAYGDVDIFQSMKTVTVEHLFRYFSNTMNITAELSIITSNDIN